MPLSVQCPICKSEVSWERNPFRPFCSERCQLLDLGAWTEGRYRIPGQTGEPETKEEDSDDKEGSS